MVVSSLALLTAAQEEVTPVKKVIKLLEDLKNEVEGEGSGEAGKYNDFACFCKSTTETKASSITGGRDNINTYSADIEEKTATKQDKITELEGRKADHESLTKELHDTTVRCAKEQAQYEASSADFNKAIFSLEQAIRAMEESKPEDATPVNPTTTLSPTDPAPVPSPGASSALVAMRSSIEHSLELADALDLIPKWKHQAVSAFLQTGSGVDPADPTYKYHSQGIIDTLTKLLEDFRSEKSDLDTEWSKTKQNCDDTKRTLGNKISANSAAMDQCSTDIDTLSGDIATAREDLVSAESMLKDDQQYLKDLTERCELRANDWDQRSQMRADEIKALSEALNLMKNDVSEVDTEVNKRALLLQHGSPKPSKQPTPPLAVASSKAVPAVLAAVSRHGEAPLAFLQEEQASSAASRGGSLLRGAQAAALSMQMRQEKVVTLLSKEGQRLGSATLSALAAHLSDDPFNKVKGLIQELIERLLKESTAEATKKGWCDEELGKANKDRDFRLDDTRDLDVEIQGLELKQSELEEEITLLTESLGKLRDDLNTTTIQRGEERDANLDTVNKAKKALPSVRMAINLLKIFYKQAAKAKVLLQASPVDEDTNGAGFAGVYKGKQTSSEGIIGLLKVIESDFDRTIRMTEASEQKAHEEFVVFDRTSRADISGKETKKELDQEDLKTTLNAIAEKTEDLQSAQDLLDQALYIIMELKPTCIDTGMSYEDRAQKRVEEISALKNAVCILDSEGVEADCSPSEPAAR